MQICPKCSRPNLDYDRACIYCGSSMSAQQHVNTVLQKKGYSFQSHKQAAATRQKRRPALKKKRKQPGNKRWLVLIGLAAVLLCFLISFWNSPEQLEVPTPVHLDYSGMAPDLGLDSGNIVMLEADTGAILYSKNPNQQIPPASTTKLMTILLSIEALERGDVHENDTVSASLEASLAQGSSVYLQEGESMTFKNILRSVAVKSANDAAVAVAEHLGGSIDGFVEKMNQRASKLGMKNTHFVNVNGLPVEGHYSSAGDMARLGREAVRHPMIFKYTNIKSCPVENRDFRLVNTNRLLWWYDGVDGLKTGWTTEAQHCVVATAKKQNMRLVTAVFANPKPYGQFRDAEKLFNYAYKHFSYKRYAEKGQQCGQTKVWIGREGSVNLIAADNAGFLTKKGKESEVTFRKHIEANTIAPVQKGEKLGYVEVYWKGKLVRRIDLIAANSVAGWL